MGGVLIRIANTLLIIEVYLFSLVRRTAKKPPGALSRVLVVQTAKLGDMICTTPVLRALRLGFPAAHIEVLGDTVGGAVLRGHSYVDGYIDSKRSFFSVLKSVRQGRFDAAVVLIPDRRSLALAYLGGVHYIAAPYVEGGFSPWMSKGYRWLLALVDTVPHRMGHYAPQEYLNMLRPLGIESTDTRKELFVDEVAQSGADARLAHLPHGLKIAIAPGAGNKIKEWPPENFAAVARHLLGRGTALVIIGAAADKELAAIVKEKLPPENVLDTTGALSIEELKGIIKRMNLFISADTGPIYIAEAFGVPTVDIVGPVDEREQPPIGPQHRVVVPERVRPELYVMNARMYDAAEARRQAQSITIERVEAEVDDLLTSIRSI